MNASLRMVGAAAAVLLTGLCAPVAAAPATYRNPVLHADYSDPDVIRVGRDYYMVASSFHVSPGLPVLTSKDLVHWRLVGHVLPRLDFAPEYDLPGPNPYDDGTARVPRERQAIGQRYGRGVWAPSIRHRNGLFYVYFATPDEGVFVATAKSPAGPWSKPHALIRHAGLEDPCPFWDDDGNAYLVHSKVGAGPLILHRMSPDGMRVLDEGKLIVEDPKNLPVLEGPKLYKRDGWYYIFAPIGGVEVGPQAVLRSRSIWGPYEHRVVLEKGSTDIQGPHQGGWVETPSGQGWFLHFNATGGFGRIVHLQPVAWRDGWPVMGQPMPGKTSGQPVLEHPMPDVGGRFPPVAPLTSDEFGGRKLGVQWAWNHNPDDRRWSLSARPGFLRLTSAPAKDFVSARNTLTQMQYGPASEATTRLDVRGLADGQRAGLSMFGRAPSFIAVAQEGGRRRIVTASAGVETPGPAVTAPVVQLRMTVQPDQTVRYAFSTDGRSFTPVGEPAPFRFSWWKGARPAVFTFNAHGQSQAGVADFDWFRVRPLSLRGE